MMKALRCSTILVGVAGLLSACNSGSNSEEAMIAAANDLDARFIAAFNAGDAEAFAATYWQSPDVVSFPPDAMEARGWEAVSTAAHKMVSGMTGAKIELTDMNYFVAGEYVIGWGLWRLTMPGPDGNPVTTEGRYTDVKAEHTGKWVYGLDHASVPMAPPDE